MSATSTAAAAPAEPVIFPWSPFCYAPFTVLWTANVVSSLGGWMYIAASGWLMTSLNADPFIVSMVQVATTLPLFLFALPAGALADILDRRKFLICVQIALTGVSAVFAVIISLGLVTPANLLLFTFLTGVGGALTAPAWQAIVSQLVPKPDLPPAVAANSVGFNVSRAVGPALGGVMITKLGIAAPFWLNTIGNLGMIGALLWWRPSHKETRHLPGERFGSAIHTGLRCARNNPPLRATLVRGVAILLFASAYWALLPLVARQQMGMGPGIYSLLLGAIGAGAVGGHLPCLGCGQSSGPIEWWRRGPSARPSPWCYSGSLATLPRLYQRASLPACVGSQLCQASTSQPCSRSRDGCALGGLQCT